MRGVSGARAVPVALAVLCVLVAVQAAGGAGTRAERKSNKLTLGLSGTAAFKDASVGHRITECPQAGLTDRDPAPLDRRKIDEVEELSNKGDDVRGNQDYACFPQNETAIDTNPRQEANIVGGTNDYRLPAPYAGFYATTNGGKTWYDGLLPPPSIPSGQGLDAAGDPAIVFDRAGIVYYASINFNRTDDTNALTVHRSSNGGFTWSRPCVAIRVEDPDPDRARCGGPGDARQPGDGLIAFNQDEGGGAPFHDKEYIAAGPRPAGVEPVCYGPITKTPRRCDPDVVGADRIYVTWTLFAAAANINLSFSDDEGRSWSPPKPISGSAPFCGGPCDSNQFSVPTVHPTTGLLGVAWENGNTPDENQYLFVRSRDGGETIEGPYFVTSVFDVNFPRGGIERPDCTARGAGGSAVYTNSCFRTNAAGNVVVDRRDGDFSDDFYLVLADNRNGTRRSTNSDVFLFKSTNGGSIWMGPTRVNDDRSKPPDDRDCGRSGDDQCPPGAPDYGNDQWWPWVDVGSEGQLNVAFHDRRLDRNSRKHEWPTSRERPGNYLVWTWGAQCQVTRTQRVGGPGEIPPGARDCLAPGAEVIPQPTGQVDPGDDPVPGQGPEFRGGYHNFQISDTPSNFDYSFRSGIFAGDYNALAVGWGAGDGTAYALWTDARNGRSAGGPAGDPDGSPSQPGRNPICEQSDAFFDSFTALRAAGPSGDVPNEPFLVTPCPKAAFDARDSATE